MIRLLFQFIILLIRSRSSAYSCWAGGLAADGSREQMPSDPISRIDTPKRGKSAPRSGRRRPKPPRSAQAALADGSITAKIKAKMTLDDTVQARDIHVDYQRRRRDADGDRVGAMPSGSVQSIWRAKPGASSLSGIS